MKKVKKIYEIVLLSMYLLTFILFIITSILDQKNKAMILFFVTNQSIALLLLMFSLIMSGVYLIILGIYKKRIIIAIFSVSVIVPIMFIYFIFALTTSIYNYKIKIEQLNETIVVVDDPSLHGHYTTIYEKQFLFIYKKINSYSNDYICNEENVSVIVENEKVIFNYINTNDNDDKQDIIYYDYDNKTFYIK